MQFLCCTKSRGGGEWYTAVVKLQLEIDEDLQNVFCVWPKLRQACRRRLASALPTHSIVCATLPSIQSKFYPFLFSLNAININFSSRGFDDEFVAVQSPSPSSLALETSYEDESIFSAPMGPLPRCQYSLPLSNIPLNRWIALTCSHRSSPQLNTARGLADLRERLATYGASRFFCFPISIRLNSSQRRANWQLS